MVSSPFVSTAWLEDHLADPDLRIIEVCSLRETIRSIARGIFRARSGCSGNRRAGTKPIRDFITPAAMAKMFGGMGIGPQSTVVLYGDPVQYGSYAFWAFTMAGHANLRLLDGGRREVDQREKSVACRRTVAAFSSRLPIRPRRERRRCGLAAAMCATT